MKKTLSILVNIGLHPSHIKCIQSSNAILFIFFIIVAHFSRAAFLVSPLRNKVTSKSIFLIPVDIRI